MLRDTACLAGIIGCLAWIVWLGWDFLHDDDPAEQPAAGATVSPVANATWTAWTWRDDAQVRQLTGRASDRDLPDGDLDGDLGAEHHGVAGR